MSITHITLAGLAETGLLVSLLIAVFLPLRPILRRFIGSQWLCLLWLALLARLLMPWPLESRLGLLHVPQSRPAMTTGPLKIKVNVTEAGSPNEDHAEVPPALSPMAAEQHGISSQRDIPGIIWLAGVALGLCMLAWRLHQTRRLAAATLPATDQRLLNLFASIPEKYRGNVELRMTRALDVPTLAGVFHPQIWMPAAWPAQFTDEELHNILLHELGHARRHDLLAQWLFALAQCIHWFNPLVWIAARAARFDREMACDAWVLACNGVSHSEYGAALMKTIQLLRTPTRSLPATVAMASSRGSLRTRITGIGVFHPTPAWRGVAGILSMIAALAAATTSNSTAQNAPASQTPAPQSAPAPDAKPAGVIKNPGVALESKFVEITEEDWKKLCAENPMFKDLDSKFPELATEKISYADLKDHLTQPEKGSWEIPTGTIRQLSSLSTAEFASMLRVMNETKGMDLLSSPQVTTRDNQQATVEVIREFRYPTEFEDNKDAKPIKGTNEAGETVMVIPPRFTPTAFVTKNVGVTLEVKPKLGKDGAVELDLSPSVVTWLGFLTDDHKGGKTFGHDYISGRDNTGSPVFSTSSGKITATAKPGETLLLGGTHIDCDSTGTNSENTFDSNHYKTETTRRVLLVFITCKITDLDKQPKPTPAPSATPAPHKTDSNIPYGTPVDGKPGFVTSPFSPDSGAVDVRGFPPNTEVKDPYTGKIFLVP